MMWREVGIRLFFFIRLLISHGLIGVGGVLFLVFGYVSPDDLAGINEIAWGQLLRGDWSHLPSLEWTITQLTTINCVTKTLAAVIAVCLGMYVSDLAVTGRKQGWHLIGPYASTSRLKHLQVWALLVAGTVVVMATLMVLIYGNVITWMTALKIAIAIDLAVLAIFTFVNRGFESWQLRVPEIEERREARRCERQKATAARRQTHEIAEQRRAQYRDIRTQIQLKTKQIEAANREIQALQSSGHDAQLVQESVANLQRQKSDLNNEIQQLFESIPART